MKIKRLIKDIPGIIVKGSKDLEISGVCLNSKIIAPGNLFIARKGALHDGSQFIREALSAGAAAILTDIYDPSLKDTQLIHPNVSQIAGLIASQYYQRPSSELFTVGITGTNGKTTTSYIVKHLLDNSFGPCGLIGTIEYLIGNIRYQATRTTPDECQGQKLLREMILQKCRSAVMEVTSHALDQKRVDPIDFDVAVFTNLTHDHLDYHLTLENYATSKQKLFSSLDVSKVKKHKFAKTAIVNKDSFWHAHMLSACQAPTMTYGINNQADLQAKDLVCHSLGTTFKLIYEERAYECFSPFVGLYNVYNFLAAVAVGLVARIPIKEIIEILAAAPRIPGRLESVSNPLNLNIFVDYAHSDDALENVLECLQKIKRGRILTIFGCGGNRDQTKRSKMAQVSEKLSDLSIVTTDNPRNENPEEICRQIIKGFTKEESYLVELDRKKAIKKGIELAEPEDILLIAGKGHENYQIFANKTIRFDDRLVAHELCSVRAQELNLSRGEKRCGL